MAPGAPGGARHHYVASGASATRSVADALHRAGRRTAFGCQLDELNLRNRARSMTVTSAALERRPRLQDGMAASGGEGGIRTHGELAPTAVFKTAALNHSATSPLAPPL